MINVSHKGELILVLENIEETRDGIEELLNADGYRVDPARNEKEAVIKAMRQRPDLILIRAITYLTTQVGSANIEAWNRRRFRKPSYTFRIPRTAVSIW
jgi:DNA-binding NtrC family response regulator